MNGGKMFGQYPTNLTQEGLLNAWRGRMVPTMSFESMWSPVVEWLGVSTADFVDVFPNAVKAGTPMISKSAMYT